jgi:hypothetical protein
MRNVHEFDRRINILVEKEIPTNENYQLLFDEFLKQSFLSPDAKLMAKDIIENSSKKNIDEINNADARVILYQLLKTMDELKEEDKKKDMYFLLNEQLQDMQRLGPCAQGRTIRLWQLLKCIHGS